MGEKRHVSINCIGLSATWQTNDANIPVHGRYLLVGSRLEQLAADELFERQHNAVFAADTNGGATILDRLDGIFDLEVPAIWREDGVGQVIACTY